MLKGIGLLPVLSGSLGYAFLTFNEENILRYTKVFREHVSRLTGSKSSVTEGGGGSGEGGENEGEWRRKRRVLQNEERPIGYITRACGFYLRSSYSTALMAALPNMEGLIWEVGSNLHPAISELHIPAATHNGYVRLIARVCWPTPSPFALLILFLLFLIAPFVILSKSYTIP
ncbi:hypothetical protein HZH68_002492 [Vespula germanica]|uniref:Uncharacterized protein n=1 Tax=Vespula germanica TaxID=30212 RepID=A0A834NMD9_VESGE|nr:hypothetical protein HZH68_002492 [Vespula germanica]